MEPQSETGASNLDYARRRQTDRAHIYRLWRRTEEVFRAIDRFAGSSVRAVLDMGTADGQMLASLRRKFPEATMAGVEYGRDLAVFAKKNQPTLGIVRGDIRTLSFAGSRFDVAVATAVIEHIPEPRAVFQEAHRVLREGGIFILTAPDPFWEHVASLVGHLQEDGHHRVLSLEELAALGEGAGFQVLKKEKFMLSPVGMPFEFLVEKLVRAVRLNFLFANQLLVLRKP
jgi:SAM-dependent methyltransferase